MAIQNSIDLTDTGIITHDGAGVFTGSLVTEGAVLLAGASNLVNDTGVLAKGTIIVGDGIVDPELVPVGADDTVLTADSTTTSGVDWKIPLFLTEPVPTDFNRILLWTDFIPDTDTDYPFASTGVTKVGAYNNDHPGLVSMDANEDMLNGVNVANAGELIGGGEKKLDCLVSFNGAVPVTNGQALFFGWGDNTTLTSHSNHVGFFFDPAITAANWNMSTENAGTQTNTDSGTAVSNAGVFQKLSVVINAAATSVEYFIDNVSQGTVATNIPSTATPMLFGVWVDNITVGDLFLDYIMLSGSLTNVRL